MKTQKIIAITSIIIVLIIIILLIPKCVRNPIYVSNTVTHTDTIPGDTVPYYIPVDKPYPVYRDTGSIRTQVVDTFAIIRNYLTKNIYKRVLKDDSSAYIAITDTTFKNELQSGRLEFQNRKPTAIITNITTTLAEKPTPQWHAYLGMSTTINTKVGFSPAIGFQDKKGRIYTYQYDVVLKIHQAGILFQLK